MSQLIDFFARHKTLGNLMTVFFLVVGFAAILLIRREVFPNINFDIITVQTTYAGASTEEIEKIITNPIEQGLREVDGIKRLRSISIEGFSNVVVILDPDQTTETLAKDQINEVIDRISFPAEVRRPTVTALQSKQSPIIEVAIGAASPAMSEMELRRVAKDLQTDLERVSGVARVVIRGLRDLEIRVEANPELLARQRISLDEIVQALRLQNLSIPAGTTEPLSEKIAKSLRADSPVPFVQKVVRTVGDFKGLEDVANTVIRSNELGEPIRVSDVAEIFFELERPTVLTRVNGSPSLSLTVLKKERADAITTVEDVRQAAEEFLRGQEMVQYAFINDFSEFIVRRVSVLTNNMIVGLTLVILLLSLFLPWRISVVVALGITIAFAGAVLTLYSLDQSINLISLMGLILVAGMLVDDAVVVTDNIYRHMEEKPDRPLQAAIDGAVEIWPAITASVSTTMMAFFPMLLMSGVFGKFIQQIPMAVIVALILSLFESLLILPQHMAFYVRVPKRKASQDSSSDEGVQQKGFSTPTQMFQRFWETTAVPAYVRLVRGVVSMRYLVALALILFMGFTALVGKKRLDIVLFPPEGIEAFFVRGESPPGSSLEYTSEIARVLEAKIAALPKNELQDFVTTVGIVQQEVHDPNTKRGGEYVQVAVYLTPESQRRRTAAQIIEAMRSQLSDVPGFDRVTFEPVRPGPPVGKPISIGVQGREFEQILPAVADLRQVLEVMPGVQDLSESYSPGKAELHLKVDQAEARAAGLSVSQVGNTVRGAFDGLVATSIVELDDEVEVRVQFPAEYRATTESLNKIYIPNNRGALIPLMRIVRVEETVGVAAIEHENNQREVRITGDVDVSVVSARALNREIRQRLPEILKDHPQVNVVFGGEDEDTQESLESLGRAFILAFMGIFFILVLIFNNIFQPFLVLLTVPLGLVSVAWTLIVFQMPISFLAMLGVIALSGVIVNNAILYIDFVNQARAKGMDRFESIEHAAGIRLRPIFLTTLTTVAGLLPTAHGIGGLDKFVVPIAIALGYGLFFGSMLTLLVFPAFIAIVDDVRNKLKA